MTLRVVKMAFDRAIEKAKGGDFDAGEDLLRMFAAEAKTPIERYIGDAFLAILDGVEPREALNIKRPPHRRKERERQERNRMLALCARLYCQAGLTQEAAFGLLAERMGLSESTVRDAFRQSESKGDVTASEVQSALLRQSFAWLRDTSGRPQILRAVLANYPRYLREEGWFADCPEEELDAPGRKFFQSWGFNN